MNTRMKTEHWKKYLLALTVICAICICSIFRADAASKIKSKSVSLNTSKVTVSVGDIVTLNAIMKPTNSTDTISWSSSKKSVATVNKYGVVTAVKDGTATITAKTSSKKKAKCTVTVKKTLSEKEISDLIAKNCLSEETIKKLITDNTMTESQVLALIKQNSLSEETVKNMIAENTITEQQALSLIRQNSLTEDDVKRIIAETSGEKPATVTNDDIIIRDPFILATGGKYYLYGTEGDAPFSGTMDKFLVYTGTDLEHWEGPYVAFQNDGTFWADQRYWAPSVAEIDGKYYLYGTMGGSSREKTGIQTFVSDSPLGPFTPASEYPFTSESYECIDAEIYIEDGKHYMIYSRKNDGDKNGFYAAELNEDHTAFAADDSKHIFLFNDTVGTVPWAVSSMTDGAAMLKTESGKLVCFFSTRDGDGVSYYNMGYAVSDNGRLDGNWTIADKKMLPDGESGGHNMFFTNLDGDVMTTYHSPNVKLPEFGGNPIFQYVTEDSNGEIVFSDTKP